MIMIHGIEISVNLIKFLEDYFSILYYGTVNFFVINLNSTLQNYK